ncbi:hypothetical protein FHR71_001893 [Methylobacterium sp. RAS18]|nr:hypothetical protein [Methylobacterium sp. RAS18]
MSLPYDYMRRIGGGWHLGTVIAVPNGDTLIVNIERCRTGHLRAHGLPRRHHNG